MKTALFISYDGLTDPLGQSQILPYLIRLSRLGYTIHILSFEKAQKLQIEGGLISSIIQDERIVWHQLPFTINNGFLSKLKDRNILLKTAKKLHKEYSFSLIHCRSYLAAEAGLHLYKLFGVPFIFDMRGFWPDEKVDGGHWKLKNPIYWLAYKFYKLKEKSLLLGAAHIITLTNAAKEYLTNTYKQLPSITVIPCCADFSFFDPSSLSAEANNSFRRSLEIRDDTFIVNYTGSTGGFYLINKVLELFLIIRKLKANAHLLIVTQDKHENLRSLCAQYNISNESVTIVAANRMQVQQYLAVSNIGVFFIQPTFSKIASSPTKHAEYLAMNIPVLCNPIGDLEQIIEKTDAGLNISLDSLKENDLAKKIEQFLFQYEEGKYANLRGRAIDILDLDVAVNSYQFVYNKVLNS